MRRRLLLALLPLLLVPPAAAQEVPRVRSLVSELAPLAGSDVEQCLEIEYSRLPREPARIDWPLPEGALSSDLPPRPMRRIDLQGEPRLLESTCRRLVPLRAGELRLPAARIRRGTELLEGGEAILTVQALPTAGRPASFSGAVGSAGLQLERQNAPDGTTLFDLTLTGRGPLDLFPLPEITPAGLVIDLEADSTRRLPDGSMERRLRFRAPPGTSPAPRFRLALFDPRLGRYRSLQAGSPEPAADPRLLTLVGLLALGAAVAVLRRFRRRRTPDQLLAAWAGVPPGALDRCAVLDLARQRGLDRALVEMLRSQLDRAGQAGFAPPPRAGSGTPNDPFRAPAQRKLRKAIDKLGPYQR